VSEQRVRWGSVPALTLVGLFLPPLALGFAWWWHQVVGIPVRRLDVILLVVFYSIGLIGVEVGYHRCFAHRAFEVTPWGARLLAVMGGIGFQGALFWWVATHRRHHGRCDRPGDPHSPNLHDATWRGRAWAALWAHWLWVLLRHDAPNPADNTRVPPVFDLLKRRELWLMDRGYAWFAAGGLVAPGLISLLISPVWQSLVSGVLWGGLLRVLLSTNAFMALNSLGHLIGTRPNKTADRSRNNGLLALLTFGQGWHNNHHAHPRSASLSFKPWQIDPGYVVIKLLLWTRLAHSAHLIQPAAKAALTTGVVRD
jgi:stearoyl-CoA desaturase (Delta-9 desaturase)